MSEEIFSYNTIRVESEGKFQSRGSKFIAYAFPMDSLVVLEERISELKYEHPKARHHCYGYRILSDNGIREYSSDDGEPSGSAGNPILSTIKSEGLLNVGSVVARYFGGTKLGIPGLIEAYKESTHSALLSAQQTLITRTKTYHLTMPMSLQPHMLHACKKMDLAVSDMEYAEHFQLQVHVPLLKEQERILKLFQILSGRDYTSIEEYLIFLNIEMI